jgi:hypothetical protein
VIFHLWGYELLRQLIYVLLKCIVSCMEGNSLLVFGWAPLTEHAGGNLEEGYQLTQANEDLLSERDHGGRRASEWEQGIYGDEAGTGPGEQQKRQR